MSIHDPAWPGERDQRATIHRALDVARSRDAMGLFANGWLLSPEKAKPRKDQKQ